MTNWMEEVLKRKEDFLADTQNYLRIKSVLDESTTTASAPFGKGIDDALRFMLNLGEKQGYVTKNVDGYAGHIEIGQGEELLGILCHVDVVPEGDGWDSDPYVAEIRNGEIFARGVMDDKGPTLAAFYAMKIVSDLGVDFKKRVRLILGTDEESEWRCVNHYFKKEEMPTIGFIPDACFPMINAEKGIHDFYLHFEAIENRGENKLISFRSGERFNMVPDFAEAIVCTEQTAEWLDAFSAYIEEQRVEGEIVANGQEVTLKLHGLSAHGAVPFEGVSAGLLLAKFLQSRVDNSFLKWIDTYLIDDLYGKSLGIAYKDDITGDLTINAGIFSYTNSVGKLGLNLRYPVTTKHDEMMAVFEESLKKYAVRTETRSHLAAHHVDAGSELIKTLQRVYEEQTGEEATLLAIGGGTYARSLPTAVAFGAMFPDRPGAIHEKNEHMLIDDLLKATALYAQAIYELAVK